MTAYHRPAGGALIEAIDEGEDVVILAVPDIVVALWRRAPTPLGVARVSTAMHARSARGANPLAFLNVIDGASGRPDPVARAAIARAKTRDDRLLGAIVHVFPGRGFVAAIARSVAVGLQAFSPPTMKTTMVSSVAEGVEMLATWGYVPKERAREIAAEIERRRAAAVVNEVRNDQA